jgi:hypothetical protein
MRPLATVMLTILSLVLAACSGGSSPSAPVVPPVVPPPPPVNSVPVAFDVSAMTNVDELLDAIMSGQDADGDALTYSITALPTMGSVEILDAATGAFRFTPLAGAFGTDLFRYRVNDGNDNSPEAAVSIMVNRKPTAEDQSMRAATTLPANGDLVGTDEDGDPVSFVIATQPANGTVVLDAATGAFTYNATANFEGSDSFTYQTNDGFANSPPATVTLSVNEWLGTLNLGTADNEDMAYGLQIDEQMNLYVAYSTTGSVPGYVSSGERDVVLAKIDKAGTVLWQKQWGTATNEFPYQLERHSDGSLYLTVIERVYDAILDEYVIVDNLVVKFNDNGDFLWEVSVPTANTIRQFYRLSISPSGNVYVNAFDMVESYGRLLRITPDGTIAWTKLLGAADADAADPLLNNPPYDSYFVFPRGLAVDATETIYMNLDVRKTVAGVFTWSTMLASFNGADGTILSRLDPLVASAFPINTAPVILRDVRLTAAGNLCVLGNHQLPDGSSGLVTAELDTAGNEIWATARNVVDENRFGYKGVLAADGSSIVQGRADTVVSAGANIDVGLTKFDSAGDFVWENVLSGVQADGTTDVINEGSQPVVDANGSVFILINSDGGAIGSATNQGGFDVFIVKLDGDTGEMIHP